MSNYSTTVINGASAYRVPPAGLGYSVNYSGANNEQITMMDAAFSHKLSTVAPSSPSSMTFAWQNFK